ncbi:hypothetical protein ES702_06411 [subsurface metagenome]
MVYEEMMGMIPGVNLCEGAEELIWPDTNPETIAQDESKGVTVEGGVAPFTWEIVGTDFTLDHAETQDRNNTVNCDASGCGSGIVSVTDACGKNCGGALRCDVGSWVLKSTNICVRSGIGTEYGDWEYELIKDNWRQRQTTGSDASGCPAHGCEPGQETFCTDRGPLGLTINCVDPLFGGCDYPYAMPCSNMDYDVACDSGRKFLPGDTECWQCLHVAALSYWEWEC